jgi:hypothetical protein
VGSTSRALASLRSVIMIASDKGTAPQVVANPGARPIRMTYGHRRVPSLTGSQNQRLMHENASKREVSRL